MRGRKKIPTKLKVIKGTNQKCRNLENEMPIISLNSIPKPPDYFNDYAKKEWNIACENLSELGLLAKTDILLLTRYCYAAGMCEEAERTLSNQPKVGTQKNKAGEVYKFINKWINIWNYYCRELIKIASEFGFTPASRTRISAPKQNDKNKNRDSQMFGR